MTTYPPLAVTRDEESESVSILPSAFSLGWATAHESHLPELPQALARLIGVRGARVVLSRLNGTVEREYVYPPTEPPDTTPGTSPASILAVEHKLGKDLKVRIQLEAPSGVNFTKCQGELLRCAGKLIFLSLDNILVQQRDQSRLGDGFRDLSEREWQICEALEQPFGEKKIAEELNCSRHTLHGYVKSLYRKIQVRSRIEILNELRKARERVRRGAMNDFARACKNDAVNVVSSTSRPKDIRTSA